jgi:hypothetical protein
MILPASPGYSAHFFRTMSASARGSAEQVVPLMMELVQPRSVVDVGSASGSWLSVFREHGVEDVLGIDGDYVRAEMLEIPLDRFLAHDLAKPLRLSRQFDLVICLEVAEHLPQSRADSLVDDLASLGSIVLFSAAIPFQGGTHHVNEQWPEYWIDRFVKRGFEVVDCLRRRLWNDERVAWFYSQNTFIFATSDAIDRRPELRRELSSNAQLPLALVHPRKYLDEVDGVRRLASIAQDIASLVTPGEPFILVDQEEIRTLVAAGARAIPFLELNGIYAGLPADDETAIRECERLRQAGAEHILFAWPAFWWLDHYRGFAAHLSSRYRCAMRNDRVVAFHFKTP